MATCQTLRDSLATIVPQLGLTSLHLRTPLSVPQPAAEMRWAQSGRAKGLRPPTPPGLAPGPWGQLLVPLPVFSTQTTRRRSRCLCSCGGHSEPHPLVWSLRV